MPASEAPKKHQSTEPESALPTSSKYTDKGGIEGSELVEMSTNSPELFTDELFSDEELEIFSESEPESEKLIVKDMVGEVALSRLKDLCRVCAQPASQYVSVFSEQGQKLQLVNKIDLCLPIAIDEKDKLPLKVCKYCIARLQASYKLATLCQKSDCILNEILQEEEEFKNYSCDGMDYEESHIDNDEQDVVQPNTSSHSTARYSVPSFVTTSTTSKTQSTSPAQIRKILHTSASISKVIVVPSSLKCVSTPKLVQTKSFSPIKNIHQETHPAPEPSSQKPKLSLLICPLCYKAFYTVNERVKHMNEGHIFMCLNCNFKIKGMDKSVLDGHRKICHKSQTKRMPTVLNQKSVESPKSKLKTKVQSKGSSNDKPSVAFKVRCNKCYIYFQSYVELNVHNCIPGVECKICNTYCETIHVYKSHVKVVHSLFPCKSKEICLKYFDTLEAANKHHRKFHQKLPKTCHICGKLFSKQILLTEHIDYIHENRENKYKCNLCEKTYRYRPKLKEHMVKHHVGIEMYKCPNCPERFGSVRNMRAHISESHCKKSHKCQDCQAAFINEEELKTHIESSHTQECIYKCCFCDFTSKSLDTIQLHVETHNKTSEDPKFYKTTNFQCKICLSYYENNLKLIEHLSHKCI